MRTCIHTYIYIYTWMVTALTRTPTLRIRELTTTWITFPKHCKYHSDLRVRNPNAILSWFVHIRRRHGRSIAARNRLLKSYPHRSTMPSWIKLQNTSRKQEYFLGWDSWLDPLIPQTSGKVFPVVFLKQCVHTGVSYFLFPSFSFPVPSFFFPFAFWIVRFVPRSSSFLSFRDHQNVLV